MHVNISIENLKKIKEEIFDKNISNEDKDKIKEEINKEIEEILDSFEESEPIDE